jgi:AraC-like DNA-binding protein
MKPPPTDSQALQLLISYVEMVQNRPGGLTPELEAIAAAHVRDLAALAMGAPRSPTPPAQAGGLRAARLAALKTDIDDHLVSRDLSLEAAAARQGVSARYARGLFEGEGTTFTDHVREQRLLRARLMLADPDQARRNVSTIAYACGFGDLSYFNHAFRRRFGATPSEIRRQARAAGAGPRH